MNVRYSTGKNYKMVLSITAEYKPVHDKKEELGKKISNAPTPSERSPRNRQVKLMSGRRWREGSSSIGIMHDLFLQPTLKRQKKKKRQQDKINITKNVTMASISIQKEKVKSPFVCTSFLRKIRFKRLLPKRGRCVTRTKNKMKAIRCMKIRRLARCGGLKNIPGLVIYDEVQDVKGKECSIPPPFVPKDDDPYIVPKHGHLISYLWYTRPSPVFGRKNAYRTGVLCSRDGLIRFCNGYNDVRDKKGNRKDNATDRSNIYEGKFYLNRRVFKDGKFRVRSDLTVGAECYESEMDLYCKILEIDVSSGAVLVESLFARNGAKNSFWISPDELVGNFKKAATKKKGIMGNEVKSFKSVDTSMCSATLRTKNHFEVLVAAEQEVTSNKVGKMSPTLRRTKEEQDRVPPQNATNLTLNVPPSKPYITSCIGETNVFNNEVSNDSSSSSASTVRKIIDLTDNISGYTHVSDTAFDGKVTQSPSRSIFFPISDGDSDARNNYSNTNQLELTMMHGKSLEILMSTTELPTMVASLQFVRSMQQTNVPLGPTALEVVTEAEMTSRALMEDALFRQMTSPIYIGGKGYNLRHAAMIVCSLKPMLGSYLGGLHNPSIDTTKLLNLGLNSYEALDILPYIQKFEDDILAKILSIKRELTSFRF